MDTEEAEPGESSQTTAAVILGNSNDDVKGATQADIQLMQREDSTGVASTSSYDKQERITDKDSTSSLPVVSINESRQDDATIAMMAGIEKPTQSNYKAEEDPVITEEKGKSSRYEDDDARITVETEAPSKDDLYRGDDAVVVHSDAAYLVPKQRPRSNYSTHKHTEVDKAEEGYGCCGYVLIGFSVFLMIILFPVAFCLSIKIVSEYERAVIFRLGRTTGGAKGPGMFMVIPCTDDFVKIDLRTKSLDIPPQEILSRDSVTVAVDAIMYYRIFDPVMSVCNVENAHSATSLLAATTLRNVLGTKTMSEILTERENIAETMQQMLDSSTDPWGIKVERVEIKDVRLPHQLQRAMAAEAEASREARAKVLAAEGEQNASRALKEAADIIMTSPAALQLRYLQTLNTIAAEKNSTIVFPLPVDLLAGLMKK